MRKWITVVVLLLAINVIATAQTVKAEWNENSTSLDLFWRGDGAFAYALGSKNWAEAYAGVTHSLTPWAEIALGVGLEQADNPLRFGGWVWLGQGRTSFLHLFENGGSGPWHKTTLSLAIDDNLSAGIIDRSYMGRGVFAEFAICENKNINITDYEGGGLTITLSNNF